MTIATLTLSDHLLLHGNDERYHSTEGYFSMRRIILKTEQHHWSWYLLISITTPRFNFPAHCALDPLQEKCPVEKLGENKHTSGITAGHTQDEIATFMDMSRVQCL